MLSELKIRIKGVDSPNDKLSLETEIDVLKGVEDAVVDEKAGDTLIKFDKNLISKEKILERIENLGYEIESEASLKPAIREHIYFVKGMHCASCEVLIEKKLLELKGIKSVEAKADKGEVLVEYAGKRPNFHLLNSIFRKENYVFSDYPFGAEKNANKKGGNFFSTFVIASLIIIGFIYLNKSGFSSLVNVNLKSSLPTFFTLGFIAGMSTCAALVGGMVLSMSKQWLEIYSERRSTLVKLQPHLLFNAGRIASYFVFGTLLGAIGSKLQISFQFTSSFIIIISILMVVLALQILGVKSLRKLQFTLPRFATRYIADESNFKGRYMPFSMGALTFFLPCGFTITAQGMALLSGNPLQGGLIMFFFALGTVPSLLLIGFSAVKFSSRPRLALQFSRVAGILIMFFALFNINNQFNVLGFPSLGDVGAKPIQSTDQSNSNNNKVDENGLAPLVNGKQVLKMEASSRGYQPNYFKVKAGIPVKWEIRDIGTSGCTNAVISRSLFDGEISLTPGQTSVKEFTPQKPGKYKFSCWMGMISGIIEVVGPSGSSKSAASVVNTVSANNDSVIPSGATGCGCGGGGNGGGSSCGAR